MKKNLVNTLKKVAGIILGFLTGIAALFMIKEIAKIKKEVKPKNWAPVNDTTIQLVSPEGVGVSKLIKLPKDPETKKQLKVKDIEAVGVSKEGGEYNVKIKHDIVNRRNIKPGIDSK